MRQKSLIFKKYKDLFLNQNSPIYINIFKNLESGTDFIANLGHSTFFIYINGIKILTDPFLYPHIFGIKRKTPALRPELLPSFDYILISHAHYDHLDLRTLRRLDKSAKLIIPENTLNVVNKLKFRQIIELKHWESLEEEKVQIISLPVQHNKGRSLLYPNTETSSYFVKIENTALYFAGDTGYFENFKEYGKKFSIDFAFLPIGGYEPNWLLHKIHMSPEEAVETYLDLKATYLIPIHFGTFHTISAFIEKEHPVDKLINKATELNLDLDKILIIYPNELKTINLYANV